MPFRAADAWHVREVCLCLNTRALARVLTATYDDALSPSGLRMTQFALLAHVRALTTPTIGDIATAMSLDQTTASRNVEVLRREGLLSVERENRRTIVDLTRAGNRALERAFPLWKAAQEEATRRAGGEAAWMDTKRRLASLVGTAENEPPTTLRGR